jgi:2-C-methyl-D-erythritol 4-phosphate cytidylyltransferase
MDVPHSPLACTAIIVAAGSSRRMGFDKLAAEIRGVPVLRRTLEAFLAAKSIGSVVVVCPQERWHLLEGVQSDKPVIRVDGGANRQDSVAAGLARVSSSHVAVHDGARPLIDPQDIDRCVAAAAVHRASALARRVTETLKRADDEGFSHQAVSRENLWFMETPQIFAVDILKRAYAAVADGNLAVTDEVSALEAIGVRVKLVESTHPNLKITTPADLVLAEAIVT